MNAKTTIRKILFIAVWLCIGGGMLTLLLAAISKKNRGECRDYKITLQSTGNNFFIDEKDVVKLLAKSNGGAIKGQPVSSFNLHQLEAMLERNTWISDAELYFDSREVLHVTVIEKEPVGRIFTSTGNSFYIDAEGNKMPLSDKLSAKVPVFTGYPDVKKMTAKDSVLMKYITTAASLICKDSFWMSQVAQIDIAEQGTFEMIPVVGNHIVRLGSGENIADKFRRLFIFYQQVLSKTGFDKYKVIDVQYKGQIVVSKQAGDVKVSLSDHRKNVEKLIKESTTLPDVIPVVTGKYDLHADSTDTPVPELKEIEKTNKPVKQVDNKASNPNPLKPLLQTKKEDKNAEKKDVKNEEKTKVKDGKKTTPKAVMPKKETEGEANGGYN